jgi:hypothetical protein
MKGFCCTVSMGFARFTDMNRRDIFSSASAAGAKEPGAPV